MSQMKINKQDSCYSRKSKCVTQWFFLYQNFAILWKNILLQVPCLLEFSFPKKNSLQIYKNHHNCLQYERVLKNFYFHILNIAKFGQIYLWTIAIWETSKNLEKDQSCD